jgi:carbon monoxide dehydrogenase subunit G
MEFNGRYVIPASPEAVWAGLNDPAVLKTCIPGCEEIEKTSPTDFIAAATLKIGPVKARFKGKVALSELDPPKRCVLSGEGQGGVAGFAKGSAEVLLAQDGSGTVLTYTARANVGGKLAQIGQRLIDGAAKQIADDFFGRFAEAVSKPTIEVGAAVLADGGSGASAAAAHLIPPTTAASVRREGLAPEIWVIGLIGVVVILLLLFSVSL